MARSIWRMRKMQDSSVTYANAPEYHIMTPAGSLVDGGNREYIFAMRMRDKDELQKDARF